VSVGDQLSTVAAVGLGGVLTYIATYARDRRRTRDESTARWAQLRVGAYSEYLSAAQLVVAVARRLALICPGQGGRSDDANADLRDLESAHVRRALATESVRLVGSLDLVRAVDQLNQCVWRLQEMARGDAAWNADSWRLAYMGYLDAMFVAQKRAREELQVPGTLPDPPNPPSWHFSRNPSNTP
jgi:hypothetical protein